MATTHKGGTRTWPRRPHFAPNQRLTAQQLNAIMDDELRRQRLLTRALHGHGVVFGYALTDENGHLVLKDHCIDISCGLIIDRHGRDLYWPGGSAVCSRHRQQAARLRWLVCSAGALRATARSAGRVRPLSLRRGAVARAEGRLHAQPVVSGSELGLSATSARPVHHPARLRLRPHRQRNRARSASGRSEMGMQRTRLALRYALRRVAVRPRGRHPDRVRGGLRRAGRRMPSASRYSAFARASPRSAKFVPTSTARRCCSSSRATVTSIWLGWHR